VASGSIKELIQGMQVTEIRVVSGVVTQEDPLHIRLINDEKMELHPGIICLPKHLTDYEVEFEITEMDRNGIHSHPDAASGGSHNHEGVEGKIKIKNALKEGDTVMILSFNRGKKYYILDREEEE